jgi:hypothetical protein
MHSAGEPSMAWYSTSWTTLATGTLQDSTAHLDRRGERRPNVAHCAMFGRPIRQ